MPAKTLGLHPLKLFICPLKDPNLKISVMSPNVACQPRETGVGQGHSGVISIRIIAIFIYTSISGSKMPKELT